MSSKKSKPEPFGPHVNTFLSWLKQTEGRDKLYRLAAYFSKFVVDQMKSSGFDKDTVKRVNDGAKSIALTRKLMRMFRSVEFLQGTVGAISEKDDVKRYLNLIKNASLTIWMVADHIQWLQKAGYLRLQSTESIDRLHSQSWFVGLITGFIQNLYELNKSLKAAQAIQPDANGQFSAEDQEKLAAEKKKQFEAILGLAKNGIDTFIPTARLKWLPISDGTVGLLGTITSFIGIYQTWPGVPKSKTQ